MPVIDCMKYVENLREEAMSLKTTDATLSIIQVGDDPASNLYVKSKMEEAPKWGVECRLIKLPEDVSSLEFQNCIREEEMKSDGVIVQRPLPYRLDQAWKRMLHIERTNVDGMDYIGRMNKLFDPCTADGIVSLLKSMTDLTGKNVTLIGRGEMVGGPLIQMLIDENCTLTVCHSHTRRVDFDVHLAYSDIVISAVGKPNLFSERNLPSGCIVIDAGISRIDGKQVGDFSHEGDLDRVYYTPWTKGIGKVTVATLMHNTVLASFQMDRVSGVICIDNETV